MKTRKPETGNSIVHLHIKNWRGSELRVTCELPESMAREVSRSLYTAQTGNCRDTDRQLAALVREGGTPMAQEIAHRIEWLSGLNSILADEVEELHKAQKIGADVTLINEGNNAKPSKGE